MSRWRAGRRGWAPESCASRRSCHLRSSISLRNGATWAEAPARVAMALMRWGSVITSRAPSRSSAPRFSLRRARTESIRARCARSSPAVGSVSVRCSAVARCESVFSTRAAIAPARWCPRSSRRCKAASTRSRNWSRAAIPGAGPGRAASSPRVARRPVRNVLSLRRLPVALRSQPSLPQPLVPGAGAVALLAQPRPLAEVLPEQAFLAQRIRQHRRGPVDGGLPLLQQADQNVALLSREMRELEADAVPALDALVQIDRQVELLALLLQEGKTTPDAVDLVLRGPLLLQGAAGARQGLVERPGRFVPMAQERPKAVGRLRLAQTPLEPGGLGRRLDHQAVEMLHLEPARRARHVPLRIHCPGRRSIKFIRTEGKRSRAYLVVPGPCRKVRICARSSALRCVFFSAFMRSRTDGQSFRSPGSYARWQDVHLARYTRSSGDSGREGAELQAAAKASRSAAERRFTD